MNKCIKLNSSLVLAMVLAILMFACTPKVSNVYPVQILNKNLDGAFSQYKKTTILKRNTLKLEKYGIMKSVKTCRELLELLNDGFSISEEVNNMRVASEYQICTQVESLQHAVAAKISYLPKPYTTQITDSLDLQSIRSSFVQKLGDTAQSINSTDFLIPKTKGNSVEIDNNNWFYQFNVLATGDFNNDGKEDLMIEFIEQAKKGNYYSHSTYFLTREVTNKYLTVIQY